MIHMLWTGERAVAVRSYNTGEEEAKRRRKKKKKKKKKQKARIGTKAASRKEASTTISRAIP